MAPVQYNFRVAKLGKCQSRKIALKSIVIDYNNFIDLQEVLNRLWGQVMKTQDLKSHNLLGYIFIFDTHTFNISPGTAKCLNEERKPGFKIDKLGHILHLVINFLCWK